MSGAGPGLKGDTFPCEAERAVALRCAEKFKSNIFGSTQEEERQRACQTLFDAYNECRAKVQEARKLRNNGGKPMTFF